MERPGLFVLCLLAGAVFVTLFVVGREPKGLELEGSSELSEHAVVVSGTIMNMGSETLPVPNVRIAVRDICETAILVREVPPSRRLLRSGEGAVFRTRFEDIPERAMSAEVYLVGQSEADWTDFVWTRWCRARR